MFSWPSELDWALNKIEKWFLYRDGYRKLQPLRLSRGYESMLQKPKKYCSKCSINIMEDIESYNQFNGNNCLYCQQKNQYRFVTLRLYENLVLKNMANNETSTNIMEHGISTNSRDIMENVVKVRYNNSQFLKLQKRQQISPNTNEGIDIFDEEGLKNIFQKIKMDNNNNGLSYNNLEEDLSVVFKKIRFLNLKLNTSQNENAKLKTRLIELEHELSNERTKNAEVLLELKTSKELINKLDKNEYSKCSNDAKQESQLQLLTNKLNSMSDKLKHSQNENSQLKQNEQKLLSELEQLKSAQDIFNAKYSYALTTFDKLNNRYKDLESKQHSLLSVYEMSCSVGDSMSLRLKHHHSALKSCKEKNEEILDKLILQEDELTKLKTTSNVVTSNDKLTVIDDVKFVTDCQECMKDVKNEISKIMDYNKELNDLLQETLEKHFTFQENEIKLKEKIKDMEKQLQLQKTTEN